MSWPATSSRPTWPTSRPAPSRTPELAGRVMLCRRAEMLPIECIVRGYLTGSAWKEYRTTGAMHGSPAARRAARVGANCPSPCSPPSTKAAEGHDENISFERAVDVVGEELATQARDVCIELYRRGAAWAADRGVIIADTASSSWGSSDGELVVADEVLTPDLVAVPGRPTSGSRARRQHRRSTSNRCGTSSTRSPTGTSSRHPPPLPAEIVLATRDRYVEAYERITGLDFLGLARCHPPVEPRPIGTARRRCASMGA